MTSLIFATREEIESATRRAQSNAANLAEYARELLNTPAEIEAAVRYQESAAKAAREARSNLFRLVSAFSHKQTRGD